MDEKELNKLNKVIVEEVTVMEEVIHSESHEIPLESHEINSESHEIQILFLESHEIQVESHEIQKCMRTPRPTLYEQNETPGGSIYWEPHVEGIPIPVEGAYYGTIDEALDMYIKYAEMAGFEVKKGGQRKTKSRAVQHKYIYCNKEGVPKDNSELVAMFWADEVSKCNYKEFGDIVSFDATFNSNKDSSGISCDSTESHQISLVIPFKSYEILLESHVILVESQEIILESHMMLLNLIRFLLISCDSTKSHQISLVILFESYKISLESHVILVESQEILLESHVILLNLLYRYNMKFVPFIGIDNHGKCPHWKLANNQKVFTMLNAPWSTCDQGKFQVGIVVPIDSIPHTPLTTSQLTGS
ncbi:FAR1-related sequence 5-like protein [Tanacetum coccineum]